MIPATTDESLRIIQFYGTKSKIKLTYDDFLSIVLPSDQTLRKLVMQRQEFTDVKPNTSVESALSKVFQAEIEGNNRIQPSSSSLVSCQDYNLFDAFRTVDKNKTGFITKENLALFLKLAECKGQIDDAELFIRRLDKDKDGKLSYSEFVEGLIIGKIEKLEINSNSLFSDKRRSCSHVENNREKTVISIVKGKDTKERYSSVERYMPPSGKADNPSIVIKNLSTSFQIDTKISESKAKSVAQIVSTSPIKMKESLLKAAHVISSSNTVRSKESPNKSPYKTPTTKDPLSSDTKIEVKLTPSSKLKAKAEFVIVLEEQLAYERKFEHAKEELLIESDFNLIDAFKIFDQNGKGFVTLIEFNQGLKILGVAPQSEEISCMFNRYDKDSDGRMRYPDFCDLLMPKKQEFDDVLSPRPPYKTLLQPTIKKQYLSSDTREILKCTIEIGLEVERGYENIRQRLQKSPSFNAFEAFSAIDTQGKKQITTAAV